MRRASILIAIALAACGDDPHHIPDAKPIDAPVDGPGGSNAARGGSGGIEPSPPDHNLELGVFAVSVVVAVGPVRARRRRRNTF